MGGSRVVRLLKFSAVIRIAHTFYPTLQALRADHSLDRVSTVVPHNKKAQRQNRLEPLRSKHKKRTRLQYEQTGTEDYNEVTLNMLHPAT